MSFSFAMRYQPAWQRRYGECADCHTGIIAGSKIMVGTGYFNQQIIKRRYHYDCWLKITQQKAADWFFANEYKSTKMSKEKALELNRLRAKRLYIKRKGGEPNDITEKLVEIEQRIAIVKSYME